MLTPTDVHYLVGLLTLVSSPESVEIMLGDLVFDEVAEEDRDVDVTVTYRDANGNISAFTGIEVKRHARPLDVGHVEQLCAKLNDMPDISRRAVVSASGYTQPAKRKAEARGVELLSLTPWSEEVEGFEHIQFSSDFTLEQHVLSWIAPPSIEFNPYQPLSEEIIREIKADSRILNHGEEGASVETAGQLYERLCASALQQLVNSDEVKATPPGSEINVNVIFNELGNAYLISGSSRIQVRQAVIAGTVTWVKHELKPEFKVIVRDGELKPYVGCAVAEMLQGNLIGFTVSRADRTLKLINVPLSDRNRKKVYKQRLK